MTSALVIPAPRRLRRWRARCRERNLRHTHLPPQGSTTSSPASPAWSGGDSSTSTADTAGRSRKTYSRPPRIAVGRRTLRAASCRLPGPRGHAPGGPNRVAPPWPRPLSPPAPPHLKARQTPGAQRLGSGASQGGRDHPHPKNSA